MRRAMAGHPAGDKLGNQLGDKLGLERNTRFEFPSSSPAPSGAAVLGSILYAEDDLDQRGHSIRILAHSGYAVTPVQNGLQAWEALQSNRFDLLITDHHMPGMTGLELAAKTRLEGMKLPIIVASRTVERLAGTEYDWLRVAAMLAKPFGTDELLTTVRQVLCTVSNTGRGNDTFIPGLTEVFRHITPYRRWGINE